MIERTSAPVTSVDRHTSTNSEMKKGESISAPVAPVDRHTSTKEMTVSNGDSLDLSHQQTRKR